MVLLSAGWLWADLITDPRGAVLNGGHSTGTGPDFSVSPINGGGIFDFFNNTNDNWTFINLVAQFGQGNLGLTSADFNCTPAAGQISAFLNCSFDFDPTTNTLHASYFGVVPPDDPVPATPAQNDGEPEDSSEGVAPGGHFFVSLNTLVNGKEPAAPSGGWAGATLTFSATPEPRTILLLLTAAGALLTRHRLRRRG
jgi:hypothetical protein